MCNRAVDFVQSIAAAFIAHRVERARIEAVPAVGLGGWPAPLGDPGLHPDQVHLAPVRRIDDRVERLTSRLRIGNIYVNRNQIGAIVGYTEPTGEGVRVDSGAVSDKGLKLPAGCYVVQVGKRKFARVTLTG